MSKGRSLLQKMHKTYSNPNYYSIHQKSFLLLAFVGSIGHLFFYLVLGFYFQFQESLPLRIVAMLAFLGLLCLPSRGELKRWQCWVYELFITFTLPVFFISALYMNNTNTYWSTSLFMAAVIYGLLIYPPKLIFLYPISFFSTLFILERILPRNAKTLEEELSLFIPAYFACLMMAVFQSVFRMVVVELKEQISINKNNQSELTVRRDEALAASQAKTDFLANMSHEIRTPLNGVLGMLTLLARTQQNAEQVEFTKIAQDSAKSLLRVVNDILDFSKIEAGEVQLESINFQLDKVLSDLEKMLRFSAESKGVSLTVDLDPTLPRLLKGDPGRLEQILVNLIGNGIKFTEKGSVTVDVRGTDEGNDRFKIRFEVRDTGIGIPKDKISLLFRSFSQVDTSTTRKYGGSGLGLEISKRLVGLMGGKIGIESEVGVGSMFWFTLTLGSAAAAEGIPQAHQTEEDVSPRELKAAVEGVSILVVDDNAVNRVIASKTLQRFGLKCLTARDGKKALAVLEENDDVALILMDCHMPEMNGFVTAEAIRARGDQTPIIAFTADVLDNNKQRCLDSGMNDFLVKPFQQNEFIAILKKYKLL
ncbi:MAG: ATP-binding protein [Planctomycetota bacterium]|nr:ATP-binding protein [Planctomycetota bacterium]